MFWHKKRTPSAVGTECQCVICSMYAAGAFQFQGGLRDNHLDYLNKPTSNIETIHPLRFLIQVWIVSAAVGHSCCASHSSRGILRCSQYNLGLPGISSQSDMSETPDLAP